MRFLPAFCMNLALLALLTVLAACGTSAPTGADAGPSDSGHADAGATDGAAGDPNVLVGSFRVKLVAPIAATASTSAVPGSTSVVGKVYSGPTPVTTIWELSATEGSCRLLLPRVPTCTTPCGGTALCVADETCQAYPAAKSVGTVRVSGVRTAAGATEFTMSAVANNYQPPAGTSPPFPAFAEGDAIAFQTSGGAYAPFVLSAKGIAPLSLTSAALQLLSGQPMTLTWTAAGQAGLSTIHVKLDISHHGGSKGMIECDSADTGSLVVPAGLLTQLINLGVAGFPSVIITRSAVGSAVIEPGRVDLVISSEVERELEVPGVISCTDTSQCPGGQSCQTDLTCR